MPSRFQTPSQSLVLKEGQASLSDNARVDPGHLTARDTPPTAIDNGDHIRLDSAQVHLTFYFSYVGLSVTMMALVEYITYQFCLPSCFLRMQ